VKAIEQMFVSQASFLYVASANSDAPSGGARPATSPASGEDKKSRGSTEPRQDLYYFFFAAFLTFFTAFFTAFLTFFLAAIFLTSFS